MSWSIKVAVSATCLFLHVPLLCSLHARTDVWPVRGRRRLLTPGGASRGGTSISRDDLRDRLNSLGHTLFKGLNLAALDNRSCSLDNPGDVKRMFRGVFLPEDELLRLVPGSGQQTSGSGDRIHTPSRRVVVQRKNADIQPATFSRLESPTVSESRCGNCLTEVGYEVVEWVVDFAGQNHTVINFNNAFQFIPSGRCINENAPCNGGASAARCLQMTRAHWSLVWTPGRGAGFVAHEVPSHCECLNIGGQQFPAVRDQLSASRGRLAAYGLAARPDGSSSGGDGHQGSDIVKMANGLPHDFWRSLHPSVSSVPPAAASDQPGETA